jgi:hypothetical protein
MRASPQTQAAVEATLRQWADAYTARGLDQALSLIAPDDDVVGIGTGQDEWRVGAAGFKAQLERDFSQAEALSVDYEPLVGRWSGRRHGRSLHRRPGAARRPLAAHADPLLPPHSRAGRGSILLSSTQPHAQAVCLVWGRAGAANRGQQRCLTANNNRSSTAVSALMGPQVRT